jgi:catalase
VASTSEEKLMRPFRDCAFAILAVMASVPGPLAAQAQQNLPQQIADVITQLNGGIHTGYRFMHAKGLVVTGSFTPTAQAHTVSKAAHLAGPTVPVTVRFSDGTGNPMIPDPDTHGSPRGVAIRFNLAGGAFTDIVAISHNGFVVGTGEDFLAFLTAVAHTTPTSPHPSPIEQFLGGHPRALKFVQEVQALPVSFATIPYFGNNAFLFVDGAGTKRAGRYQILPAAGVAWLDSSKVAKAGTDYLFQDIAARLAKGPVKFKLALQLANPGDQTIDGSIVWPADRKVVELGTITLTTVAPDNAALQRKLTYNPIYLTSGIELSDDPIVPLRSAVYALSVAHRQ